MRTLATVLGTTAIGLGALTGVAVASPQFDSVQGTAQLPQSSGGGTFHFDARSGPSGEDPGGLYWAKDGIFGTQTFTSQVECLEVQGNLAYIGTRVTRSEKGAPEGDAVVFRVQDNGTPGAGRDQFVGTQGIDPTTDCRNPALQAVLTGMSQTISQGDFTVHDAQP